MSGKVVLIGAGPGDPLLLTLRGKEYISQADCIVYDRLANSELLAYAPKTCDLIYVGKENHHHTMKQEDINKLLAKQAEQYKLVVRLKGGDSYVFGRGGEEALFLKQKGIELEVVPGISSVIATLEDAGIPITHRGLSKGFQVVTAHSRKDTSADINYNEMLDDDITYLYLMGLAHVEEIAKRLIAAGKAENTPVAVISNGTTARQKKVIGNLGNISSLVQSADLPSPAIIVVGKVVTLANELDFFEKRPLFGKKYIVPFIEGFGFTYHQGIVPSRIKNHFDSELGMKLRELGAEILSVKVGAIHPVKIPKQELLQSISADYIVFTSQNGVNAFLWNLKEYGLDVRKIGNAKLAVVGKKTGEALSKAALQADIIPEIQNGNELCTALIADIEQNYTGKEDVSITFYGALNSNEELKMGLQSLYNYKKIVCYENCEEQGTQNLYEEIDWKNYDGIFFTSGSAVKRMKKISAGVFPDNIYSIGPKCSEVIESEIGQIYREAKTSDYTGLIELVK